jgi:hypothetical protein
MASQELKVSVVRAECRLGDIVRVHPHLMVARTQVKLGEEASPVQLIEKLIVTEIGNLSLDVLALRVW